VIAALEGSAKLRVVALAALVGVHRGIAGAASETAARAVRQLARRCQNRSDSRRGHHGQPWRVEAAEKNRDSARAEFFPDVSINALLGLSSINAGKLLEYGSRCRRPARPFIAHIRCRPSRGALWSSQAAIDTAVASYQDTWSALPRRGDAGIDSRANAAQRTQRVIEVDAAHQLQRSAAARVRQGITDARTELTATESWMEQRDALLQLDAAALSADIALQRALAAVTKARKSLRSHSTAAATTNERKRRSCSLGARPANGKRRISSCSLRRSSSH